MAGEAATTTAAAPAAATTTTTATTAPAEATQPVAQPAEGAAQAATTTTGTAAQASEAQPDKQDPATPAQPAKDEIADGLADLNRLRREAGKLKTTLEASQKEHAAKLQMADAMAKAREYLGAKDFAGALEALAGEAGIDIDEAAVLLIEQAQKREQRPLTQADAERIAAEKFKAEREAAEKRAAELQAAQLEQAKQDFGLACSHELTRDASKYPLLAGREISDERFWAWVLPEVERRHGAAPTTTEVLQHFEAEEMAKFAKDATRLGYTKAEIREAIADAKTSAATGNGSGPAVPVADTRGAATPRADLGKKETLAEMDARHKRELRAAQA